MKPVGSHAQETSGARKIEADGTLDLRADIELLGVIPDPSRRARVAITSYEFAGVVRNGGIGTACTALAIALAEDGHDVDLFFTGWEDDASEEGFERWRLYHRGLGVDLHRIDMGEIANCESLVFNATHSLALYRALKKRDEKQPYDVIHFVESLGHGFYSLLAKHQGLAFQQATTIVGTHSPRRWLAEAHGLSFDHPAELGDEFLEVRSLELADVVVSPSKHMLDWLRDRGVQLPQRSYVQQYASEMQSLDIDIEPFEPTAVEELVFFGRLEPRKGVVVFCDALDLLAEEDHPGLRRVTFLGKLGVAPGYLEARTRKWPWECEVVTDFDRPEALEYLRAPGRLAVMASTMDNSPNTVYEAIGLDIAFLASRGGGTAELVHPDDFDRVTYDPRDPELREVDPGDPSRTRPVHSGRVLARRLQRSLAEVPRPARYAVAPDATRDIQLDWHRALAGSGAARSPAPAPATSSEPLDVNELAAAAQGPPDALLLLVDPDIHIDPRLGTKLAAAASISGAAFVTSFGRYTGRLPHGNEDRVFMPTGGPAAAGLVGNCAGAGALVARRDALRRIGAFDTADGLPVSVGELLARAVLAGERVDIVPEALYRLPDSAVVGPSVALAGEPIERQRPYHLTLPPEVRDIAGLASRLSRDEAALRAALQEANRVAAEASAQYTAVMSSRSVRMTGPLRRAGGFARRLLRRQPRSG